MRLNIDQDYLRRCIPSRVSAFERFDHLPVEFLAPKTFKELLSLQEFELFNDIMCIKIKSHMIRRGLLVDLFG